MPIVVRRVEILIVAGLVTVINLLTPPCTLCMSIQLHAAAAI